MQTFLYNVQNENIKAFPFLLMQMKTNEQNKTELFAEEESLESDIF